MNISLFFDIAQNLLCKKFNSTYYSNCQTQIKLWGLFLYVSIEKRKCAKEQMIVVSNFKFEDPLVMYRRRWEIETMFGCLKTRGFRMEDTHISDPDKIEKAVFVLAIAFCWAYRVGDIQDQIRVIEVKTYVLPSPIWI